MAAQLVLASGSQIRRDLLMRAGVSVEVELARVDEDSVKDAMLADGAKPRDIADALAELKATKVAAKRPGQLVLGTDQVLDFEGDMLSKPTDRDIAVEHMKRLQGKRHNLLSAAVIVEDGRPVWRHVGVVRLFMRPLSADFIKDYVARNWPGISDAVGAYKLEEEGPRLFNRIDGDHFNVLGLPLLEVLSYLTLRGTLSS